MPKWKTLRQGLPYVIPDIETEQTMINREVLLANGLKTLLGIPLVLGGQVIGCFGIASRRQQSHSDEEVERAQTLAHYMTLAAQLERLTKRERHSAVLSERNRMQRPSSQNI